MFKKLIAFIKSREVAVAYYYLRKEHRWFTWVMIPIEIIAVFAGLEFELTVRKRPHYWYTENLPSSIN